MSNSSAPLLLKRPFVGRYGKPYHAHDDLVTAVNTALLLEMPLLLTGEPGCGKTHFAWAAAQALHRALGSPAMAADPAPGEPRLDEPLTCYIRSDSRARDLLYHYDAVRRFGDAQHGGVLGAQRAMDARPYIELRGLGQALMSPVRRVVLLDEIDKAPKDLPNDLLQELDHGDFEIPEIPGDLPQGAPEALTLPVYSHRIPLQRWMKPQTPGAGPVRYPKPLVIITSNVERQLPDAFLRRCVFYHIPFPKLETLREIVQDHLKSDLRRIKQPTQNPQLAQATQTLVTARAAQEPTLLAQAQKEGLFPVALVEAALLLFERLRQQKLLKRPATAELLGWLQALLRFDTWERDALALIGLALKSLQGSAQLPWSELPIPGCLIKQHEDWQRLIAVRM